MKFNKAYWISPDGNVITVGTSHIKAVLDSPEVFGFEKQYLYDVFKRHGEKPGLEGRARNEIILQLIKSGWIRMRFYDSRYSWSITVDSEDNVNYKSAMDLAESVINSGVSTAISTTMNNEWFGSAVTEPAELLTTSMEFESD
ncbi:MAG: hypothetical protein JW982_06075 [Spirochaetes bacterium]|nr:hypothetical protein [Spirochaetota bacterium]